METVLVLNANFEPINVCNMHRALGLMLTEKATLVLDGRGTVRTSSNTYPRPSVIRLHKMIRRPRPTVRLTRREILRRDGYTCQYCGRQMPDLTIDHVIPRHMDGPHVWRNVVAACPACNHRKGGRKIEEAGMRLLHVPIEPPASADYIFAHYLQENQEWGQFLNGW
jgi:5-methylcytosine-specific restriction endonuclease McrA